MRVTLPLFICMFLAFESAQAWRTDLSPSEYHLFTDKKDQQIDARILSISDEMTEIRIERRDGQVFEIAATVLSLDDQQFIRDWLYPKPAPGATKQGRLKVFGKLPGEKKIDVTAAGGFVDFVQVGALKNGWVALRSNGDLLAFAEMRRGHTNVASIYANTVWWNVTRNDGSVWGGVNDQHCPGELTDAFSAAAGGSHQVAILIDGSVKVWGRRYRGEDKLVDPPLNISNAIDAATNQHAAAVLTEDGTVYCWSTGEEVETKSGKPGTGLTMIEGGIFHYLGLGRDGEVYEWGGINIDRAKIPKALAGQGPFINVSSGGSTKAAQRADGSWIAWGKNGAGIVDHINQLGPVIDLKIFSEPGPSDAGYIVWIEPEA